LRSRIGRQRLARSIPVVPDLAVRDLLLIERFDWQQVAQRATPRRS
jgi:hypothetical protein